MPSPSVDIIVPVWSRPLEARACLSAILAHSPEARLIIVDNGSDRQTQLVLEEFSEPLAENCLFISSDRNVGLVRAINMGLARSDGDYVVIVRPHVTVTSGWLDGLLDVADAGMASPLFAGPGAPFPPPLPRGCSRMETFGISFATLALRTELFMLLGGFDEQLDGGEWCLRDYVSRAGNRGYRTSITATSTVICADAPQLGSDARRREIAQASRDTCVGRWGAGRHYGLYFGKGVAAEGLADMMETVLAGARLGHRFTMLLHPFQAAQFRRLGWDSLHTSIQLHVLSRFMPERDLRRTCSLHPEMIMVSDAAGSLCGNGGMFLSLTALSRDLVSPANAPPTKDSPPPR
jgi:hypothetical protein